MSGSRPWTSTDRTGAPLDDIFLFVRSSFPRAVISRIVGTYSADDDNVFWVEGPGIEVQIDTFPGELPPFTVESDAPAPRLDTSDVEAAKGRIRDLLRSACW
jgi:hypothetical protein